MNITNVISSYQDDELEEEKPKKAKITASKSRSSLLSKLPKAANDSATMTSKLDIKPIGSTAGPSSNDKATEESEPIIKPSKPMSTTMFMPNSTKNRLQSQNKKVITEVKTSETKPSKKKKEEEDSDDDEPFFSFT